jgi:DNA-binding NarL/FixJ family response regulator
LSTTALRPIRVLVVDDARSTRRFVRAVLEVTDRYEVVGEADNGVTAVTMAAIIRPDVVLLDISMPEMDGRHALRAMLRAVPGVRVVVLSAMDDSVVATVIEGGAIGFIPKGLPPDEFLALLDAAVRQLPQAEPQELPPEPPVVLVAPRPTEWRAVICDDNPMDRHLVGQVLETCGIVVVAEVAVVPSLMAVVEMAKPDLVLLDLWLEGAPGSSALPEIQRVSPHTVVVVYSAHEGWRNQAMAAGAAAFVAKPNFYELQTSIRRLVPGASLSA